MDDTRGLLLEDRDAFLPSEHVELAVGNHPSLRIGLVLPAARDIDCAIAVELRRIAIGIGDEQPAMLGILEPIGRAVERRRKFGRSFLGMAVRVSSRYRKHLTPVSENRLGFHRRNCYLACHGGSAYLSASNGQRRRRKFHSPTHRPTSGRESTPALAENCVMRGIGCNLMGPCATWCAVD